MASDYKDTMNLPQTDFPMRAGLPASEPKRLEGWYRQGLYQQMLAKNAGNPAYILHDGPPYANGPLHSGHALNKILKDIVVKYKSLKGFFTPFVPGWDCHGQPIEHMVETQLGPERMASIDQVTLRRLCREHADLNIDIQRQGFKRIGVLGDWDNPYLTFSPTYEAANVKVFKAIYEQGAIYRGRKPVHWCPKCHTALAEAEIEYSDEPSPSIYVAFGLVDKPVGLSDAAVPANLVIWTTTPWTLPANVAVAISPQAAYVAVMHKGQAYIMAEALVEQVTAAAGWMGAGLAIGPDGGPWRALGQELAGLAYRHPIHEGMDGTVVTADHVDLATGSGAVHTAPGHGQDDFLVGEIHGLPMLMPVDDDGIFDAGGGRFAGLSTDAANPAIIEWLEAQGTLLGAASITHSYPHCWRCHQPVIFRATEQWFVSMDKTGLREAALAEIDKLAWYPEAAQRRLRAMVEQRPDWCISRQRSWGVPIPVFRCGCCDATVATTATFDAVIELFETEGADAWFAKGPADYLPAETCCDGCGAGLDQIKPERDILDVWWESGISHTAVLDTRRDLARPASLYLEGSDQHRGWFQSSLLTSVGAYGAAPYEAIMSAGFVVDEEGKKMSKSLGNGVDPDAIYDKYGADVLRLWVGSQDSSQDVSISDNIIEQLADAYRRIRNTFRFLLSNLYDFDSLTDKVGYDEMCEADRWALASLASCMAAIDEAYEHNRFHQAYRAVYDYIVTDLSAVYLDAAKDRLYSDASNGLGRRSAQTVLAAILGALVRQLAPILSFTCDEVWEFYPKGLRQGKSGSHASSVFLDAWPRFEDVAPALPEGQLEALLAGYSRVKELRDQVTRALEEARLAKLIGKSQEARVLLSVPAGMLDGLSQLAHGTLEELFIVAEVVLSASGGEGVEVAVEAAAGEKCPRCWNVRELGGDAGHPEVCPRCAAVLAELERHAG
jgi:isoleucyl-tRNA synthetase